MTPANKTVSIESRHAVPPEFMVDLLAGIDNNMRGGDPVHFAWHRRYHKLVLGQKVARDPGTTIWVPIYSRDSVDYLWASEGEFAVKGWNFEPSGAWTQNNYHMMAGDRR